MSFCDIVINLPQPVFDSVVGPVVGSVVGFVVGSVVPTVVSIVADEASGLVTFEQGSFTCTLYNQTLD